MESSTWVKDSHGLFDYETSQVTYKVQQLTEPAKVIRTKQDVTTVDRNYVLDKANEEVKGLANIGIIRGQFWIYACSQMTSSMEEPLWIVLRNYISEDGRPGHKLREGDVIKMGRCKYWVREMVRVTESRKSVENLENTLMDAENGIAVASASVNAGLNANAAVSSIIPDVHSVMVQKLDEPAKSENVAAPAPGQDQNQSNAADKSKKEERQCRICLGEDSDPSNPLIESPCACIGSVRLMHVNCLKHWLQSKVTEKRTDSAVTYIWKQFECEVCKSKYPGELFSPNQSHR